jgi:dihydrofolate synthase/folylpolyglutamate synthase
VAKQYKIQTIKQAENALLPFVPLVAQLTGKDTTLKRITPLMALLGNPEQHVRVIHIAGTSGKTSTAYYLAALLGASGKKVGLTVSPHVDRVTERLQLNGQPLADLVFCHELELFLSIVEKAEQKPSYFELLYAFAIWEFVRTKVDYAVVETGMGGLYDATNVVTRPDKICVITDIGFDHMHILGNTLPEIAAQKIGIVHDHNQVIMYDQQESVMQVVRTWTKDHDALLLVTTEEQERQSYNGDITAMPVYQQRNWLLAYRAYQFVRQRDELSEPSPRKVSETQKLQVPGRMDVRDLGNKILVMDGAHNGQKMTAFIESFKERYPNQKPAILLALKQGKEYEVVVPLLVQLASRIIITTFKMSQDLPVTSIDPTELAAAFSKAGATTVEVITDHNNAFQALLAAPEKIVIITGSFYLLSLNC